MSMLCRSFPQMRERGAMWTLRPTWHYHMLAKGYRLPLKPKNEKRGRVTNEAH